MTRKKDKGFMNIKMDLSMQGSLNMEKNMAKESFTILKVGKFKEPGSIISSMVMDT